MRFQSDHGLDVTGAIDVPTWHALVTAAIKKNYDPTNYSYVLVSKSLPETLTLYVNGNPFFSTNVNTGISVAPTTNGTYPVYERFTMTTMSGTLPDGKTYHDSESPGFRTSTAATRCTASSAPSTGTPRAWVASR